LLKQPRTESTRAFDWGRVTCRKIVAFFATLLNFICLFGLIKRFLRWIIGYLHEALKENKEELKEIPPFVDPLFY
jgi:hypothetical protein